MIFLIAVVVICILLLAYILSPLISPKPFDMQGAHVLVTGGSSGIGKAIAIEAAKRGANITLLARNERRLAEAQSVVSKHFKNQSNQTVRCVSVDIANNYEEVERSIHKAEGILGPVDVLINSAGYGHSIKFEDMSIDQIKGMMDLNYFGSVYVTRSVIKQMKERKKGRIVFVSSQAGQLGLFGYTSYSASKFALRGLAEALQMEVKPYNIRITLAFPPDTDTPGLEKEMETSPKETRLIAETSGLFQASYVGKCIMSAAIKGQFMCYMGIDGYMLSTLTCGMCPVTSVWEATQQVLLMGLFRAVSFFYLDSFDRIVKKCKNESELAAEHTKTD